MPPCRTRRLRSAIRLGVCAAACASALSCGGGGSPQGTAAVGQSTSSPADSTANVAGLIVDAGPNGNGINTLYTSVTVCLPGTRQCQTVDHIQVDTASFGLRILSSALNLSLPVQNAMNGNPLVECMVFADGYSWGPVVSADVIIAGETASALPMQVIGDSRYTSVPSDCSGAGPVEEDTVASFGANGILGIGVFIQDCGARCQSAPVSAAYYACTQTACDPTAVPLAHQVTNPVAAFDTDNNGTVIELPSAPAQGAAMLEGSLIFGIDTQTNNASGSETVLTVDPSFGYLSAAFDGHTLSQAFVDTGSNGNYFDDSAIPQCTDAHFSDFYCPISILALSATLKGSNGVTAAVAFSVASADTLRTDNPTFTVLPDLAGTVPISGAFDFGLPAFYGRRVVTALESRPTSMGIGPYIAL